MAVSSAVACPSCGARRATFVRAVPNRDAPTERLFPTISVSVCRACGLIHQNPRIPAAKMKAIYRTLEDKPGGGVTRAESESRLKALRALRKPPARMLEVGSSDGTFLGIARGAGYRVVGLEPSRANLAKARRAHRGITMHEGFLEDFETGERFDVLCHFYVQEYSFEPRRFLAAARRLLAPDGVMLLEVPDAAAFARLPFAASLFTHQDISIYTRATLDALLQGAGFAPGRRRLGAASKAYGLRAWAKPGPVRPAGRSQARQGLAAMRRYFGRQDAIMRAVERRAKGFLRQAAGRSGPVVIFGAGENGRILLDTALGWAGHELVFCDNSAALQGRMVEGVRVIAPKRVPALSPALVVAASVDYQDDMVREMRALGVPRGRIVRLYEGF